MESKNHIRYFFKITSKQNKAVTGTGNFKVSKKMNTPDQLIFFHQYTSGAYLNKEDFINIEIQEQK